MMDVRNLFLGDSFYVIIIMYLLNWQCTCSVVESCTILELCKWTNKRKGRTLIQI